MREQNVLHYDLMSFVDVPDQYSPRHIFVGPEVEKSVDGGTVGCEGVDSVDVRVVGTV